MSKENLIANKAKRISQVELDRLKKGFKRGTPNTAIATVQRIIEMINNKDLCGGCVNLTVREKRNDIGCFAGEGQIRRIATEAGTVVIRCPLFQSLSTMTDPVVAELNGTLTFVEKNPKTQTSY